MANSTMPVNRLEKHWVAATDGSHDGRWVYDDESQGSNPWLDRIEGLLANHPRTTVVVALAVGLTLGWLGKRK